MITESIYKENYEELIYMEKAQMEIERLIEKDAKSRILLNEKEDTINEMSDENLKLKQRIRELEHQLNG